MLRRTFVLLLGAGLALGQEEKDDEGITIDEAPAAESGKPARTEPYPARASGKKPATVAIKKKVYSFALPADWVLLEGDDPKAELAWDVLLPGSTKRASLSLLREEQGDPRSGPYYQAEWLRKEKPDVKTEVRTKPCPRLVASRPLNDTDWTDAYFYRSIRNNPYILLLSCAAGDFVQAEADMFEAVRSFAAAVEIRPAVPKGYQVAQEGTWLVARAPSVTASIGPLVKTLKEQEKRFRRDHGPLPKGDAPIVVLVHASKAEGGKIEPRAAENERDFFGDGWSRRIFAVPFSKENVNQEGLLAYEAQGLLLMARYGDNRPHWISVGECTVAQAEVHTGKPLPSLHEGFAAWASDLKLHKLDELEALRAADSQAWGKESFFYVAALREGKYRKQYRAFLDDFAETGDGLGAFERHLAPIDQEELRSSTNQFISGKIKPEKPK